MKTILNRIGDIRLTPLRFFGFWAVLFALVFTLCSCDDDLDVQQSYPFTVDVMPYGDKIANGETIELRFEIKPEGNYTNTLYTIRYFQYEGDGELQLVGGPVLVNNDRVLLESKSFRLNYTAKSSDSHKFLVVVEDSFNSTPWEQTFEFNNDDSDDDGNGTGGGLIVGPVKPILLPQPIANEKTPSYTLGIVLHRGDNARYRSLTANCPRKGATHKTKHNGTPSI